LTVPKMAKKLLINTKRLVDSILEPVLNTYN
jgi:hypothetical protein